MLGFIIGFSSAFALLALLAFVARRRWRRRRRGGRHMGHVLKRLGVRPDQEGEVSAAFDELRELGRALFGEMKAARGGVADVLRADTLDEAQLRTIVSAPRGALDALTEAFHATVARLHSVLDGEQRTQLAALLQRGPGRWRGRRLHHARG